MKVHLGSCYYTVYVLFKFVKEDYVVYVWYIYGIYMVYIWYIYGIYGIRNPNIACVSYSWTVAISTVKLYETQH